jgi:hypothetical protein
MGYVPPPRPIDRLNLDRFGMPRDYATYMWLLYGKVVEDGSPARRAWNARFEPRRPNPTELSRR